MKCLTCGSWLGEEHASTCADINALMPPPHLVLESNCRREVTKLATYNVTPTMADALQAVDELRADIASGKVRGFFAVGVGADDGLKGYLGSSSPVSRLRITGAIAQALYDFSAGKIG